ncbi:hypothetical protein D3C87_958780 [compost metagenome]
MLATYMLGELSTMHSEALKLLETHVAEDSEYLRKSVGNALRDIGKRHPAEVSEELCAWNLEDKKTF